MLKLFKNFKDHLFPVALILGLLVIQAMCDLALPQYTSDIVDIGIKQSGVDSIIPVVIRESEYNKLKLLMNAEDIETVNQHYKRLNKDTLSEEEWTKYQTKYPILKTEPLYVLQKVSKEEREELYHKLRNAMLSISFFSTESEELTQMKEKIFQQMQAEGTVIEGMTAEQIDILEVMSQMQEEQRMAMMSEMNSQNEQMPEMILEQMASVYVKGELKACGVDLNKNQNSYLIVTGAKMLGVSIIAMVTSIIVGLLASRVAAKIGMDLRTNVFRKVMTFSNKEMDQFSTASLITRSTNDIQQIQMVVVMLLRMVAYAPILGIGGIIKVMNTHTSMAWIIGVAVGAVLCVVMVLFTVAMPKFKLMQKLVDRVNLVMREILNGLSVIRAFGTEKHELNRFDKANRDLTKTMLFTNRAMTFMMPMMMLIMNMVTLLIMWFGAKGIDSGNLQVGDMMAFMTYTMQIVMSFLMITMISIMLPRAGVAAERIDEIITTSPAIIDPEQLKTSLSSKKGYVEFDHVTFRYPGAESDVLSDITFTAKPGETTAFIGSTGSGKSTLVNLIPRLYDVTEGSIRVNGTDVREMKQEELRKSLGYVPQKGILFSGTIDSNIRYGKMEANEEEIKKAARIAQAEEFIEQKEEKYNSPISQGGSNVSGGQKQRLSIARAIAKKPDIYIFDDSFSALDFKTDITLRKALKEETANSTVLIVAQRISTIMHAEQIIVLDEGTVAGIGTHEELLKKNEVYRQIAMSQLSKEELSNE